MRAHLPALVQNADSRVRADYRETLSDLLLETFTSEWSGWAKKRGLPVAAGHRAGTKALHRTVEAAIDLGVESLTVYAFTRNSPPWATPAALKRRAAMPVETSGSRRPLSQAMTKLPSGSIATAACH